MGRGTLPAHRPESSLLYIHDRLHKSPLADCRKPQQFCTCPACSTNSVDVLLEWMCKQRTNWCMQQGSKTGRGNVLELATKVVGSPFRKTSLANLHRSLMRLSGFSFAAKSSGNDVHAGNSSTMLTAFGMLGNTLTTCETLK